MHVPSYIFFGIIYFLATVALFAVSIHKRVMRLSEGATWDSLKNIKDQKHPLITCLLYIEVTTNAFIFALFVIMNQNSQHETSFK